MADSDIILSLHQVMLSNLWLLLMWTKNNIIWGQASWAKMMSPGSKRTALSYHLTKK